jgi:hypothetical protein
MRNKEVALALVEISKMEQCNDAVIAVVRDGFTVTEISQKLGINANDERSPPKSKWPGAYIAHRWG